ncbi:PucR family transcriptional regulator [Rhodococcus koreensis]
MDKLRSEIATYRLLDPDDLLPSIARNVEILFAAIDKGAVLSEPVQAELIEHGKHRARIGLPLDDLLHGWRLCISVLVEAIVRQGHAMGVADAALLQLVLDIHTQSNNAMVVDARGHREAELEIAGNEEVRRAEMVRGVLHGTLGPAEVRVRAQVYGLNPSDRFHAVHALLMKGQSLMNLKIQFGIGASWNAGVVTATDDAVIGFIAYPPRGPVTACVGIGPCERLDHLEQSFGHATRALTTAAAFGFSGVHDLKSLGVLPAVLADRDVGDALLDRYIAPLSTLPSDLAASLSKTVGCYLANGQRVDPTARDLVIHPNTLRYRIKRYEEIVGGDLRETRCALEVWWALQRARLDAQRTDRPDTELSPTD